MMKIQLLRYDQLYGRLIIKYCSAVYFLICCLCLILSGCAPSMTSIGSSRSGQDRVNVSQGKVGQLSLFLNLENQKGVNQKLVIQSIELLADNNQWIPFISDPVDADSQLIPGGQIFLGRSFVDSGYYNSLRMKIFWNSQSKEISAEPTVIELRMSNPLYVGKSDSHSLFIIWDLLASLTTDNSTRKALSLAPRFQNMLVDVAYVACPDINTVYMVCTDKNRVCNSLGVKGKPSYLISDPVAPTANLFALAEKDRDIKRIGPASNRVEERYHLSRVGGDLHFTISPDSQWAYVIDRKRGNIHRINLSSGAVDLHNRLGYKPSFILYLKKQGLLAVTLSLSQSVVLIDPQTLEQVQSISTGSNPDGLMLHNDNYLYIAEAGGNSVMVYNLNLNKIHKRIPVDFSPRRLMEARGRIYVTNYNSHSISLLRHGQLGVSKTIALNGPPLELAYSQRNKWLYVGNGSTNALDIINPMNSKVVGRIELGARPHGISILH